MRSLLFAAFLVLATLLVAHGIFFADEAAREYEKARLSPAADHATLFEKYPYSRAAVIAHREALERRRALANGGSLPGKEALQRAVDDIIEKTQQGLSSSPPFVRPYSAAIIGLAGLLLALVLPGTRFRGLALLGFLFGGAASLCAMLPPESQDALVQKVEFAKHVISNFPHVAQGCVFLAGLALSGRVRPRLRDD